MPRDGAGQPLTLAKGGRQWRIGTDADVAWIRSATTLGLTIGSAIPPTFAAYATVLVPDKDMDRAHDAHLVFQRLREQSPDQPWWLGYLDTGADDMVFPDAPKVTLYAGWHYVFVLAGPDEAVSWRQDEWSWRAPGPDIAFPQDRSWLLSWLWDDHWRCIGGPTELIGGLVAHPRLKVRRVTADQDATPPDHVTR